MRFRFDDFTLDTETRELTREGRPIELPRLGFALLLCLADNVDRVVSREDLIEQV